MTNTAAKRSSQAATVGKLSHCAAIWNALWWRKIDFYPLVAECGDINPLDSRSVLPEMEAASAHWSMLADDDAFKSAIGLATQSLAEVKAQTEYQDSKATRILTITTFLSALSGALFSRFEDAYPIDSLKIQPIGTAVLLGCGYAAFAAFVIVSLSGALVTFHATRTRFKYPPLEIEEPESDPKSLLFYSGLIGSRPRAWMKGWVTAGSADNLMDRPKIREDLGPRYLRNLVSETYLVAAKTADKLRYLEPAQNLLAISLRFLFLWLLLLAPISIFLPSTKPPVPPTEVKLVVTPLQVPSTASSPAQVVTPPGTAPGAGPAASPAPLPKPTVPSTLPGEAGSKIAPGKGAPLDDSAKGKPP